MRTDLDRLADVKEAIERVEKYAARGRQAFDHDELIQTWIVHHIQIIGEACRLISAPFRDSHPEVPWKKIIGMRNALVHQYFGIDEDLVWDAVQREPARIEADNRCESERVRRKVVKQPYRDDVSAT